MLTRVIRYMLRSYKGLFGLVLLCIVISAVATVLGATFPQTLVDDYIVPMVASGSKDFSGLAQQLIRLCCILAVGIVAAFSYNRIMVNISQGTMLRIRKDLFHRMEQLPIPYFDTHPHGDIMSVYTNDVDTLRQMLSQSIPQTINSGVSMLATLVTMLILNPVLSVISVLTALVMVMVTANFSKLSGRYYVRQQRDLGMVDGFIEEMLDGQKVVKVFCHEEQAKADFHKVNEALRDSADKANRYAQPADAGQRQHWMAQLCADGHCGRAAGAQWSRRRHAGDCGYLCGPQQELYPAHHPDQHAGELCGHGGSRRPAGFRPDGRDAGTGRRLCGAGQRV